jgi:N-formylglutamate amidohydrolase
MPAAPFRIVLPEDPRTPVIAHIPHASTIIPPRMRRECILLDESAQQRELVRITDWHCDHLFSWILDLGGCLFVNGLSRMVFDPERFLDDSQEPMATVGQGVIYTHTTEGARCLGPASSSPTNRQGVTTLAGSHPAPSALVCRYPFSHRSWGRSTGD